MNPVAQETDVFAKFKEMQKQGWAHFAPLEMMTTAPAAKLVAHAHILPGQNLLDVGCGTGVVSVTAARLGAHATGLDLTPALLERARENSRIAGVDVEWQEGDVEFLPYEPGTFDVVVSQFGHMFAPRPELAVSEMLRVLKPGGTIAFATWPPESVIGQTFQLVGRYMPPPPPGVSPPHQWGDPNLVRERLGTAVKDLVFNRGTMFVPTLSLQHNRIQLETSAGPVIKLVETLSQSDTAKLEEFRHAYEGIVLEYMEDNTVRQDYLLTRATKI